MKLKRGDKVRIKENLNECEFGYGAPMEEFIGKEATVMETYDRGRILLNIDNGEWYWSEEVLELIEDSEKKMRKIDYVSNAKDPIKVLVEEESVNPFMEESVENDPVNHPSHYTDTKIEVMDYIEDKGFNFALGNVIKYVSRAGRKDVDKTIEDLEKASWYLNREIERLKNLQGK